jgi:hypothetical protein
MMQSEFINHQIWRMFPEFSGVLPTVKAMGSSRGDVLSYHTKVDLPNGTSLDRWVRVTRKPNGDIQKISTSR